MTLVSAMTDRLQSLARLIDASIAAGERRAGMERAGMGRPVDQGAVTVRQDRHWQSPRSPFAAFLYFAFFAFAYVFTCAGGSIRGSLADQ